MMKYDKWMKETAAFGRSRSKELQAIDNAIKNYENTLSNGGRTLDAQSKVRLALEIWKKAKGSNWQSSVRNKSKAVELLGADLAAGQIFLKAQGGLNSRGELMIDNNELIARKAVSDAIKMNTRRMFNGQKLTVKNSKALSDLNSVKKALTDYTEKCNKAGIAISGIKPDLNNQQVVKRTLNQLFGETVGDNVQKALGQSYTDIIANVAPFIGVVQSASKALVKWGQTAFKYYEKNKMSKVSSSFAVGDPPAAFEAIIKIQEREMKSYAGEASIYSISAGAQAAFIPADCGAISGPILKVAESLALMMEKIYLYGRDWNEVEEANELLEKGEIDLNLFKICPLLGCYLISNSDTSSIINMAVGDYGKVGWKFEVEAMVKKAKPVFEKSRSVIKESRFEIAGMSGMKGVIVDRTKKTLGIPVGKLDGLIQDVTSKIDGI